jgi:hypothetical protein
LFTSLGDIFGFLAVGFVGISAVFMSMRGKIVKRLKNIALVRYIHIAISLCAGVFLVFHIAYFYSWPLSIGILFGYGTFLVAIIVWLTGTAFLEKLRGSLQFHGSLSIVLVSLALIHAASTGVNFPLAYSVAAIVGTVGVAMANMLYQLRKK